MLLGIPSYDNGQSNEGRALVFHGSASGLSATPDWTAEPDLAGAQFGRSVGTAGDVNRDGFMDVIIGAPGYTNGEPSEGAAFAYFGTPGGLQASAAWSDESDQANAQFGWSVSTAGDVDGDGRADVAVGARWYDDGETNEGAVFVYHGSFTGPSSSPDWSAQSDQAGAFLGSAVATAGDVNGDGFSDLIAGASFWGRRGDRRRGGLRLPRFGQRPGFRCCVECRAGSGQCPLRRRRGNGRRRRRRRLLRRHRRRVEVRRGRDGRGPGFVYRGSAGGPDADLSWAVESDQTGSVAGRGDRVGR